MHEAKQSYAERLDEVAHTLPHVRPAQVQKIQVFDKEFRPRASYCEHGVCISRPEFVLTISDTPSLVYVCRNHVPPQIKEMQAFKLAAFASRAKGKEGL